MQNDLAKRFRQLEAWDSFETAWTPPESLEDRRLQGEVDAFLKTYSFLQRDEAYVTYLRAYGGALIVRDDALVLSLFGFDEDIGMHLVSGPGDIVEQGILVFCDLIVPRPVRGRTDIAQTVPTVSVGFGFQADDSREPGVYRFVGGIANGPAYFCGSFLEWLDIFIARDGQVDQSSQS